LRSLEGQLRALLRLLYSFPRVMWAEEGPPIFFGMSLRFTTSLSFCEMRDIAPYSDTFRLDSAGVRLDMMFLPFFGFIMISGRLRAFEHFFCLDLPLNYQWSLRARAFLALFLCPLLCSDACAPRPRQFVSRRTSFARPALLAASL